MDDSRVFELFIFSECLFKVALCLIGASGHELPLGAHQVILNHNRT